jgi:hypothetical protein
MNVTDVNARRSEDNLSLSIQQSTAIPPSEAPLNIPASIIAPEAGSRDNTSLRETKVKRVLDTLKAEKLSFIDLVDTVFTSEDPTIRPYADKFLTSSRASPIMASIVHRSKRGLFDGWILSTASRILSRQLDSLRERLRMPTSTYSTSSILGWTLSSTEQLFKKYAPSMLLVSKGLASDDRQQRRETKLIEYISQRDEASGTERDQSPVMAIHGVKKDASCMTTCSHNCCNFSDNDRMHLHSLSCCHCS